MRAERIIHHVAIYLRISMEKKDENVETLENHRRELTEFAKNNKWTYEEFGEVISGGKSELEDRKKLSELLHRIEEFDAILCIELSRISRNGLISQTVKQYCMDYDIPIVTPYQTYDLANNETDKLMFDVGAMISSHEHGVIGRRSKMNKKQMARQGLHVSGNIPLGYVRNSKTKKLEIDEEAAKTIRYIFHLHSKGLGSFKIRDILNEEGYKSATGKHFNLPSIKRIIRNPHYKGWTVFNDRKRIKKAGKINYEVVDTIVVKNTHPAIIPPEEWDKANKDREIRATQSQQIREKPSIKSEVTMLKDLIFCGICDRKMIIRKDNKSATGYTIKKCEYLLDSGEKCPNCGVRLEPFEEKAWEELMLYKKKLEEQLKLIKESGTTQVVEEQRQRLSQVNKRIKEIVQQEKNLIDLALSGLFTHDEIAEKKKELADTKNILKEQRDDLNEKINQPSVEDEIDKLTSMIELLEKLPELDPDEANVALKTFVKKIHYTRVMPEEIKQLSTRNVYRQYFPYVVNFEYYKL